MRLINAFLHSMDPSHRYAAFVLTKNVTSEVHRDPRNAAAHNMVVGISDFTDGGVWIQDPQGTIFRDYQGSLIPGRIHSLQSGPVYLDARSFLHATQPWSGDRLIAIAHTPQQMHLLSLDDSAFLQSLGFPVLDSFPSGGETTAESGDKFSKGPALDNAPPEGPPEASSLDVGMVPAVDNAPEGPPEASSPDVLMMPAVDTAPEGPLEAFDPRTSRAFGQPMICKFQMCKQEFVDGFGLCSPGRWLVRSWRLVRRSFMQRGFGVFFGSL